LCLACGLEALDRRDQPEQTVGDEVGLLDGRGQPARHPAGDVLHQGRVGEDEPLTGMRVAAVLVATPHLLELDGLYVRLHAVTLEGEPMRTPSSADPTLPGYTSGSC